MTSIDSSTFRQFKLLEIIDMSRNNIAEVPKYISTTNIPKQSSVSPSLHDENLYRLRIQVPVDSFQGLQRLMQLNLEGNSIKDIAPAAFSNTPLLLLMLGDNCLTTATQQMFQGISFLKQLSLANNNIGVVQPFAFQHLPNLHLLDLSKNRIKVT